MRNSWSGSQVSRKPLSDLMRSQQVSIDQDQVSNVASDITDDYTGPSLALFAKIIWSKKLVFTQLAQQGGLRPRVKMSPSELLSLLKRSGVATNMHQLKAFLRYMQVESASPLDIVEAARALGNNESGLTSIEEIDTGEEKFPVFVHTDRYSERVREVLKDTDLKAFFREATLGTGVMDIDSFATAISLKSNGRVRQIEAQKAFEKIANGNENFTEEEFVNAFKNYERPGRTLTHSIKILKNWLRDEKLTTEQGFEYLLRITGANKTLNFDQFVIGLTEFNFSQYELYLLFREIDSKQDGVIDLTEWMNKIYESSGPYQSLRDIVLENNLQTDDLLIKMDLKDKQNIGLAEFASILQKMDPTLTAGKAVDLAKIAIGKQGYVDLQDFLLQLSQKPVDYEGDWKEQILRKIQNHIKGNVEKMKKIFEDADERNNGKLPLADFQHCLHKADIGLPAIEIERLARILDRKGDHLVDYTDFLDHLEGKNLSPPDPLKKTILRLIVFLRQNSLAPAQLLKRLGGNVTIETFAKFIRIKVDKRLDRVTAYEVSNKFDMNHDGIIDIVDLSAALNSKSYASFSRNSPFPTDKLNQERAKGIIRDVRNALIQKRMNYKDAFTAFDTKNNGMLTCKEFSDGIDKVIELSQPVKNGLFAIMDKQGIGLIDYKAFCDVIKEGDVHEKEHGDSWSWETKIIHMIKKWITQEGISIENAFRAFDKDFDGMMSKEDLRQSLVSILKLEEREIPSSRLDRLYKLMDNYKRNSVYLADFKILFEENKVQDWRDSAKQQIGLYLSKKFSDNIRSFEFVSQLTGKITFQHFDKWIQKNQILQGFNLTNELNQQLFASLDFHRKGYLLQHDWDLAFGNISWNKQCLDELKDAIRSTFTDTNNAFSHFQRYAKGSELTISDFSEGVHALIPDRFSSKDINDLWQQIVGPNPGLSFPVFKQAFEDVKFLSRLSFCKSSMKSRSLTRESRRDLKTPFSTLSYRSYEEDPLKRLQSMISVSNTRIENIFSEIDSTSSGKVSSFEFRKALRRLNLGLTAREIDNIVMRCDANNNGIIDWKNFNNQFVKSGVENQIKGIASEKIEKYTENMFSYMLSPRDAFNQFDKERSGYLSFEAFVNLMTKLCKLSKDQIPSFTVLRDLFEIIDLRKDGVLDVKEWISTFKSHAPMPWENSQLYDDVCLSISKHRKGLLLTFEALSGTGFVSFTEAKNIITSILKGTKLPDILWNQILRVALKDGKIDYKFLLEVYKNRALTKQMHPKSTAKPEEISLKA
ncbi:unnamed protein product [Blepharisma stoltei]|uniref:EF-hand domain-containing protein n=1 Tax=Blepharisma stoltei TaxID=1481888 RepID=A0AAU9IFR2_9CILI|nr:unnamed protein product [Blepharisma stoltei]